MAWWICPEGMEKNHIQSCKRLSNKIFFQCLTKIKIWKHVAVGGWQLQTCTLFHLYYLSFTLSLFLDSSLFRIYNTLNAFFLFHFSKIFPLIPRLLYLFGSLSIILLIQCSAFDHIQLCFPHNFNQTQSLHEFLSRSVCTLDCNIHW